jgi:hypothetical protein
VYASIHWKRNVNTCTGTPVRQGPNPSSKPRRYPNRSTVSEGPHNPRRSAPEAADHAEKADRAATSEPYLHPQRATTPIGRGVAVNKSFHGTVVFDLPVDELHELYDIRILMRIMPASKTLNTKHKEPLLFSRSSFACIYDYPNS